MIPGENVVEFVIKDYTDPYFAKESAEAYCKEIKGEMRVTSTIIFVTAPFKFRPPKSRRY